MKRRLQAIVESTGPAESVGLRHSVAAELGLRAGEPIFVINAHESGRRIWLPGWHEVDEDEIGPDGCLLRAELARQLDVPEAGVYVYVSTGRLPEPSFFIFSWTYEEPAGERLPEDLLVLLDTSSSMNGRPLRNAKRALCAFVDRKRDLDLQDRLGLIVFGGDEESGVAIACQPAGDFAGNRRAFVAAVEAARAEGLTPMTAALRKAMAVLNELPELPGSRRRRRLILITDGYPSDDPQGLDALVQQLEERKIYLATVGVGEFFNRKLLTTMAARTRAPFVEVHQIRQLPFLLEELA